MLAISITGFLEIPPGTSLPVHWDLRGEVDWAWPKEWALLLMPGLGALLTSGFWLLGRALPDDQLEDGRSIWELSLSGVLGLFAAIHFGLLLLGVGADLDMIRIIAFAMAVFLFVMGLEIARSRRRTYGAIRLPFAIRDPGHWIATHRITGSLFVLGGIVLGLAAWFWPDPATLLTLLLTCVFVPSLIGSGWAMLGPRQRMN